MTAHVDVALAAAERARVFPCTADKRPATSHGFHDATCDPDRITAWWSRHPEWLVATPTDGLLVVDLDVDPGDEGATWDWWTSVAEPNGWQPTDTPMVATPSGGLHIYWRAPEGAKLRNTAGKLARHVDTRADGGYVIAPGSRLPDGREYELLQPAPAEPPVAPAWLVRLLDRSTAPPPPPARLPDRGDHRGTAYGVKALEAECGRVATAAEGTRNDTLCRAAFRCGQLAAGGQLDPVHAAETLELAALRAGLGADETAATIRSGMFAGAERPRRPA